MSWKSRQTIHKTVCNYITINCTDDLYDILPEVTHIMKYEVTKYRIYAFNFGPYSHLLWLRIMILGILLTLDINKVNIYILKVCMDTGNM